MALSMRWFQESVFEWAKECFGEDVALDEPTRSHRMLEEAIELYQATGCSREDAIQLIDYVYGRPVGEVSQEVGGVMVTLAALCEAHGIDLNDASVMELNRCRKNIERIREKQASKPWNSPLPIPASVSAPEYGPTPNDRVIILSPLNAALICRLVHHVNGHSTTYAFHTSTMIYEFLARELEVRNEMESFGGEVFLGKVTAAPMLPHDITVPVLTKVQRSSGTEFHLAMCEDIAQTLLQLLYCVSTSRPPQYADFVKVKQSLNAAGVVWQVKGNNRFKGSIEWRTASNG